MISNSFETAEFWYIVSLTAILRLLPKENPTYLTICHSIRGLVTYQPVAYKKSVIFSFKSS